MKKILSFLFFASIACTASAQRQMNTADTIVVSNIEKSCPGGFEAFNLYIKKNARPPAIAYENKKVRTTYVSFIIEPDGRVSHVCTVLAAVSGMDEDAIRAISLTQNWLPATIDNKPVRTFCRVGVQFLADFAKHTMWVQARRAD